MMCTKSRVLTVVALAILSYSNSFRNHQSSLGVSAQPPPASVMITDGQSYSGKLTNANGFRALEGDTMATNHNYKSWPGGFSCPSGSCFLTSVSIGSYIWMLPYYNQQMVVRLRKSDGAMTGWSSYPKWVTRSTSSHSFKGAAYDSSRGLIWMAPTAANYPVSVASNGAMNFCPTSWPGGFSSGGSNKFAGAFFVSNHLWMIPSSANQVVKMAANPCQVTQTYYSFSLRTTRVGHADFECGSDGFFSDPEPRYKVRARRSGASTPSWQVINLGDGVSCGSTAKSLSLASSTKTTSTSVIFNYEMWEEDGCGGDNDYNTGCANNDAWMASGTTTKTYTFSSYTEGSANSIQIAGSSGWYIRLELIWNEVAPPEVATTGYSSWGSVTLGSAAFGGGIYDGSSAAWLVPRTASHVVKISLSSGSMVSYNTWPTNKIPFSGGTYKFGGGAVTETHAWLAPSHANMIVSVQRSNGYMLGHNSWPVGFSRPAYSFITAAYDGKYVWFPPNKASHMIRVEAATGVMKGFNNWPSGWTGTRSCLMDFSTDQTTSLWTVPYNGFSATNSAVNRITFTTGTLTLSQTETPSQGSRSCTAATPSESASPSSTITNSEAATPSRTFSVSPGTESASLSSTHSLTTSASPSPGTRSASLTTSHSLTTSASPSRDTESASLSTTQTLTTSASPSGQSISLSDSTSPSISNSSSASTTFSTSKTKSVSSSKSQTESHTESISASHSKSGTFSDSASISMSVSDSATQIASLSLTDSDGLGTDTLSLSATQPLTKSVTITRSVSETAGTLSISTTVSPDRCSNETEANWTLAGVTAPPELTIHDTQLQELENATLAAMMPDTLKLQFRPSVPIVRSDHYYGTVVVGERHDMRVVPTENSQPNPNGFATSFVKSQSANLTRLNSTFFQLELSIKEGLKIQEDETVNIVLTPAYYPPSCPPVHTDIVIARLHIIASPIPGAAATRDAVTAVTSMAAVAGAGVAIDAQAIAVLALMACTQPGDKKAMKNNRLLSPLATDDDSYEGMIYGNYLAVFLVLALHMAAVAFYKNWKKSSWANARTECRFPSLSLGVIFIMFQGTSAASIKLLQSPTAPKASLALAGITILTTLSLPGICLTVVYIFITSTYHKYRWLPLDPKEKSLLADTDPAAAGMERSAEVESLNLEAEMEMDALLLPATSTTTVAGVVTSKQVSKQASRKPSPVPQSVVKSKSHGPVEPDRPAPPRIAVLLLPTGRWMPAGVRRQYGVLFSGIGRYEKIWSIMFLWNPTVIVLGLIVRPIDWIGCTTLFSVMSGLMYVAVLIILIFRPYRSLVANVLGAASTFCLGMIMAGMARQAGNPSDTEINKSTMRTVQAQLVITIMRMVWTVTQVALEKFYLSVHYPLDPQEPEGVWIGWRRQRKLRKRLARLRCEEDADVQALAEMMELSPLPDPGLTTPLTEPSTVGGNRRRRATKFKLEQGDSDSSFDDECEVSRHMGPRNNRAFKNMYVDPALMERAKQDEVAAEIAANEEEVGPAGAAWNNSLVDRCFGGAGSFLLQQDRERGLGAGSPNTDKNKSLPQYFDVIRAPRVPKAPTPSYMLQDDDVNDLWGRMEKCNDKFNSQQAAKATKNKPSRSRDGSPTNSPTQAGLCPMSVPGSGAPVLARLIQEKEAARQKAEEQAEVERRRFMCLDVAEMEAGIPLRYSPPPAPTMPNGQKWEPAGAVKSPTTSKPNDQEFTLKKLQQDGDDRATDYWRQNQQQHQQQRGGASASPATGRSPTSKRGVAQEVDEDELMKEMEDCL